MSAVVMSEHSRVLQFPNHALRCAKRRMNRIEIEGRHRWMQKNCDKWQVTELDGFEPEEYIKPQVRQLMEMLDKEWGAAYKPPTITEMKKEIARGRKVIEERNKIKAWFHTRGVDLGTITSVDQALSCMFRIVGTSL